MFLSGDGVLAFGEWKTVPDIWRSSAEKFGDQVALVDPYHDPPSTMTYKQVIFFIYCFFFPFLFTCFSLAFLYIQEYQKALILGLLTRAR